MSTIKDIEAKLANAIAQTLPEVSAADNGKLMGVTGGEWAAVAAPVELPAVAAADKGKLLGVTGGEWAAVAAPVELPAVTKADAGKVLMVSEDGEWVAAALPSD